MIWVVQSPSAEINRFPSIQIDGYFHTVSFRQEGRIARRHERGTGCGGREGVGAQVIAGRSQLVSDRAARRTNGTDAYGKTVWSRHPLLVPSCAEAKSTRPGLISR
jgi:hypothetical protein